MLRRILIGVAVGLVLGCGAIWFAVVDPTLRHAAFCRSTRAEFESLANKRPPDVTPKQWHHVVAWTLNAHSNCITYSRDIPQSERDRFLDELRRRLRQPVELATIDWIWDELVRLTSYGQTYSDNWRPTLPERLREFEESNRTWSGVHVE